MKKAWLFAIVAIFYMAGVSMAVADTVPVPNPTVIGPIPSSVEPGHSDRDYPFFTPAENLSDFGYIEEEFFIEGFANRYNTPSGTTGSIESSGYPYKTRIVVRRPIAAKAFNGIVVLEWQNVTAGYELDAHWGPSWEHFVHYGYAWVGVSAQRVGVHNPETGLRDWSPTRYGTLDLTVDGTITDDSLCYDVFAQAGQAIIDPKDNLGGVDPMAGFPVKLVLPVGASQSAGRLSIYINSIQPLHNLFGGYYLLVGGAGLRNDLDIKVFQYLSETDLRSGPGRRMIDTDNFRGWEVVGTGHSTHQSAVYREPLVDRDFGMVVWPPDCDLPPYTRTRGYYVINAQYDHLVNWILYDKAPPIAPKIEFASINPPIIARDDLGIALGGIRLPDVDVPIALNTGHNSGARFCVLYGAYVPFDDYTLQALYRNHGQYVSRFVRSASGNVKAGYILQEAAVEYKVDAAFADVPPK